MTSTRKDEGELSPVYEPSLPMFTDTIRLEHLWGSQFDDNTSGYQLVGQLGSVLTGIRETSFRPYNDVVTMATNHESLPRTLGNPDSSTIPYRRSPSASPNYSDMRDIFQNRMDASNYLLPEQLVGTASSAQSQTHDRTVESEIGDPSMVHFLTQSQAVQDEQCMAGASLTSQNVVETP